jgi:hypothetical protein
VVTVEIGSLIIVSDVAADAVGLLPGRTGGFLRLRLAGVLGSPYLTGVPLARFPRRDSLEGADR